MRYAHIVDGAIVALGPLPDIERAPERDWDLRDPIIRAARGWYEITETPRPDDTATTTWERSVTLVAGVPTVTWMERPWTAEELAAQAEQSAREAGRLAIVEDALVWLDQDAAQAETRAAQIAQAIVDVDTQIGQVAAYTFSGSTVAQINNSLNNALKPMVGDILARQRQIGLMLQELQVARSHHGDALVWVGRYLTR